MWGLLVGVALARDFVIVTTDATGSRLGDVTLTTPCGCRTTVDRRTGSWRGDVLPGPNGAIALRPGAEFELDASAVGFMTTHVAVRVGRFRRTLSIALEPLPDLSTWLDDEDFVYDPIFREPPPAAAPGASVFAPPPPAQTPPPAGWDCRQR